MSRLEFVETLFDGNDADSDGDTSHPTTSNQSAQCSTGAKVLTLVEAVVASTPKLPQTDRVQATTAPIIATAVVNATTENTKTHEISTEVKVLEPVDGPAKGKSQWLRKFLRSKRDASNVLPPADFGILSAEFIKEFSASFTKVESHDDLFEGSSDGESDSVAVADHDGVQAATSVQQSALFAQPATSPVDPVLSDNFEPSPHVIRLHNLPYTITESKVHRSTLFYSILLYSIICYPI